MGELIVNDFTSLHKQNPTDAKINHFKMKAIP